jgi:lipoprotein NlpD
MLESARMAKLSLLRWPSLVCLVCLGLLLGACAHARIVRRDFPDTPPASPPRHVAIAPSPARTVAIPQSAEPKPVAAKPPSPEPVPENKLYIVKAGDTLYGIARRFGLKFKDVVDWNKIDEPYAIQSGQRLHLRSPEAAAESVAPKPASTVLSDQQRPPVVVPMQTPSVAGTNTNSHAVDAAAKPTITPAANTSANPASEASGSNAGSVPVVATPTQSPKPPEIVSQSKPVTIVPSVPTPPIATAPASPVVSTTPTSTGLVIPGGPSWRWPTDGDIIGRYVAGDQTQQGIDIAGHSGQPVIAAADGVVVYSGAGLVGYGELVIIKHSNEWLSAYAHNRRRLVAEGTKVKAGDAIAEMGRTGAVSDMLHFEIRRNGKPVDPLLYLPKK